MDSEHRQLAVLLDDLQNGRIPEKDLYHTIHLFGKENYLSARASVEKFLHHPYPDLRAIALEVLTRHWGLTEHWETAKRVLETDIDEECRFRAASAFADLMRDKQDEKTLSLLALVVKNEHENYIVRVSAYAAMKAIMHFDPREQYNIASERFILERDIDYSFVDKYIKRE